MSFDELKNPTQTPPNWTEAKCGQCEYGKELSDIARIQSAGMGAPRLMDCMEGPPQVLAVQMPNGKTGINVGRPRFALGFPACSRFHFSAQRDAIYEEAPLPEKPKVKSSLIMP
jgi:hypothetical protein